MSQALDIPSRFTPPENEQIEPPPGYIDFGAWQDARDRIIEENMEAVANVLGSDNIGFFSDVDQEWLTLHIPIPALNAADTWCDGRDYYYDPDVRYDCRPDLLAKLRQLVRAIETDIQERPL
jgi:hypothetical protein